MVTVYALGVEPEKLGVSRQEHCVQDRLQLRALGGGETVEFGYRDAGDGLLVV